MPTDRRRLPKLPPLLERKIYKTGQTRGADDDEIYQNRVARTSTVLIPYTVWDRFVLLSENNINFEKGFIVLVSPTEYFSNNRISEELNNRGLFLGKNTLVFYETREQWNANNPDTLRWNPAQSRVYPFGGQYVARISATTSIANGGKIIRGFNTTSNKGAGIRVYEYASSDTIRKCRFQLEAIIWLCSDSEVVARNNGMINSDIVMRKNSIFDICESMGLLDMEKFVYVRILNKSGKTICPFCLDELSAQGFFNRMEQAEGRDVLDLTVTQLNLFHIQELRMGIFNHAPYNLGWGHHHCNTVVKDSGIRETLLWIASVLKRNIDAGYDLNIG